MYLLFHTMILSLNIASTLTPKDSTLLMGNCRLEVDMGSLRGGRGAESEAGAESTCSSGGGRHTVRTTSVGVVLSTSKASCLITHYT